MKFIDQLFSKYADPFSLLDTVILAGRFWDFVLEFLDSQNEKMLWEFYLHKVFDKSFEQFKSSVIPKAPVSNEQIETTVKNSMDILQTFNPNS